MKKRIVLTVLCLLFFTGCASWFASVADPNSGLNTTVDAVTETAPHIGAASAASGTPIGAMIFAATTIISALTGVYTTHRTKIVAGKKYDNITATTKAIVDAIESLDDPVSKPIKDKVLMNLRDEEIVKIGKAIIEGLKEEG